MTGAGDPVLEISDASVVRGGSHLLKGVDWVVRTGERWAVLGPNGSGKTTLMSVAATYLWPSRGSVAVLGRQLGSVDVRELRRHIGVVSAAIEARIPPNLTAAEVVRAGSSGALAPWWQRPSELGPDRSSALLDLVGCGPLADRAFQLLSSGEKQRVQIARALALEPSLLLLDEPFAGLDMGAREELAALLGRLFAQEALRAAALVTHHVEEIATGCTHALVLRQGRVIGAGPLDEVITAEVLSRAFGVDLEVARLGSRYAARSSA